MSEFVETRDDYAVARIAEMDFAAQHRAIQMRQPSGRCRPAVLDATCHDIFERGPHFQLYAREYGCDDLGHRTEGFLLNSQPPFVDVRISAADRQRLALRQTSPNVTGNGQADGFELEPRDFRRLKAGGCCWRPRSLVRNVEARENLVMTVSVHGTAGGGR